MPSAVTAPSPSTSPAPVTERTPARTYYTPLIPSPLNPNGSQTSPPGSPSPQTPPPKRPSLRRTASQTSPTQILLRQKAAAAFRSENLIKAYGNNNYISLGSSRRHASSRNPFLNMIQHKNLTTADTIDILYSLDIDDDDDESFAGDIGLVSSSSHNKPLPAVPMPPLFSSFAAKQKEEPRQHQQEKYGVDLLTSTSYYEDFDYGRDKEETDLENGISSFERERTTLLSGSISSLDTEGQARTKRLCQRRGGGHYRSGVTRLVIHLSRGLVILGIIIMLVLLHELLRTLRGAGRPPPAYAYEGSDSKS